MEYFNRLGVRKNSTLEKGDSVDLIIKSSLFCKQDEDVIYETGTVFEIVYEDYDDDKVISAVYLQVEEKQGVDLYFMNEIEDVIVKKYNVLTFMDLNEGIDISIKNELERDIIKLKYQAGSLKLKYNQDNKEKMNRLYDAVHQYGIVQSLIHTFLSSKQKAS